MPNWCQNSVVLSHQDPEVLARVVKAFNEKRLLDEFVPCPKPLREVSRGWGGPDGYEKELRESIYALNKKHFGFETWYEWCIANWGTKWDVDTQGGHAEPNGEQFVRLSFMSAWGPPLAAFWTMVEEQGFSIDAYYYEDGMGFCGHWVDGLDDCYEIQSNSEWIKNNIPEDIDAEFGISEFLEEQEVDDETRSYGPQGANHA